MNIDGFSENFTNLKAAAHDAPREPGVYIMRDDEGRIVYVGKARVLRNRLSSYFSGAKDVKTSTLIRHARSIETIIVASEYEALLLENTLIKQHSPKYNINLKDGKTYPVIRITAEEFPRIFRTRHIIEDKSLYFGPFPNVQAVDTMLELIEKLFPLRKCRVLKKRENPCMYYHIGRCMAPCCAKISAEEYATHVRRVEQLLAGSSGSARGTDGTSGTNGEGNNGTSDNGTDAAETLILDLTAEMHKAAKDLNFERAAQLRNAIRAIEDLAGGDSSVVDFDPEGRDYIAWATEGIFTTFTVFSMRGGKMTGRELFRTRSAADEYESLETFAASYYNPGRIPPAFIFITQPHKESLTDEIEDAPPSVSLAPSSMPIAPPSISFAPSDVNSLSRWFKEQFGFEPEISVPAERHHTAVLAMAHQNAVEDLRKRLKERGAGPALDELVQALSLSRRPERIEGFDIAQLDGKHPVASLISFKNGVPDRKNYRYFKLRSVVGIVDDFAAMREVVHRRYSRLIREGKELPDLVLIDGGIGQVNAAKGVMDELGMHSDVAGLAKRDEELWLPHAREPVRLSKRSEGLKVLQFVRDETHRFATGFNQRLRSGDLFFPVLESVEGIGPKRAAAIMKIYENIGNIAAASPEELAEKCRISEGAARAVRAAAKLALEDQAAAKKRLNPAAGTTRRGAGGGKWAGERRGGNDGSERNGDSWRAAKTESLAEAALSDAFAAEAEAEYGEESGTDGK